MLKGDRFIDFLKHAFDAEEVTRMDKPDGTIMHGEVRVGDSPLMLTEACEQMPVMPGSIYLYVKNVDAVYQRAIQTSVGSIMEPADQFYGDRMGGVKDPFVNIWFISTHIEDVPSDELKRRAEERMVE